ncbi:hypothetical protein WME94_06265 [Sorangium sp. So ce429]
MSRHHRKLGVWPADDVARVVWHLVASLDDAVDLSEASKLVPSADVSVALIKKALVEFASFDDVVRELSQVTMKTDLPESVRAALRDALRDYNRSIDPSRKLLRDIRNTIAAHRTSQPGPPEQKKHGSAFNSWGEWEQRMVELEAQCARERWVDPFNAAIDLRNVLGRHALGSWVSTDGTAVTFYMPFGCSSRTDIGITDDSRSAR